MSVYAPCLLSWTRCLYVAASLLIEMTRCRGQEVEGGHKPQERYPWRRRCDTVSMPLHTHCGVLCELSLHEKTGFSTGAIADNHQLATDLRHLRGPSMSVRRVMNR